MSGGGWAEAITVEELDADPYPLLARMRREEPVCFVPAVQLWFVTRWADVDTAGTNTAIFDSRVTPTPIDRTMGGESILVVDGEKQKKLRAMLDPSLRPRVVEASTPQLIEPLVAELLDGLDGRDEAELMSELFEPVSVLGLGRVLGLGELDGDTLRRWFHGLAQGAINFEDDPARWAISDETGRRDRPDARPGVRAAGPRAGRLDDRDDARARLRVVRGTRRPDPPDAQGDPARRDAGARSCGWHHPRRAARVGTAGRGRCRPDARRARDRGGACAGLRRSAPRHGARVWRRSSVERRSQRVPASHCSSRRQTATRASGATTPNATIFIVRAETTPPSASGRTTARAITSPGCRCGSCCNGCVERFPRPRGAPGQAGAVERLGVPGAADARRGAATVTWVDATCRKPSRRHARLGRSRRLRSLRSRASTAAGSRSRGGAPIRSARSATAGSRTERCAAPVTRRCSTWRRARCSRGLRPSPWRSCPTRVNGDRVEVELP